MASSPEGAQLSRMNFYKCIRPEIAPKETRVEWGLDAVEQMYSWMPVVNWFRNVEPDSERLQKAVAQIQEFAPVLGSRLCMGAATENGVPVGVKQPVCRGKQAKLVADYSKPEMLCGIGYGEVLDLDPALVKEVLSPDAFVAKSFGFRQKFENAWTEKIAQEKHVHDDDEEYAKILDTEPLPFSKGDAGRAPFEQGVVPLAMVVKVGTSDKKLFGVCVWVSHLLFDGWSMFRFGKLLGQAYGDESFLPSNYDNLLKEYNVHSMKNKKDECYNPQEDGVHSVNVVVNGLQLEYNPNRTIFSMDLQKQQQRHWRTRREKQGLIKTMIEDCFLTLAGLGAKFRSLFKREVACDDQKNNPTTYTKAQVDKAVSTIRTHIQWAGYWPLPAKNWAVNILGGPDPDKAKVRKFLFEMAVGRGAQGEDINSYGLRDFEEAKKEVADKLLSDVEFEPMLRKNFGLDDDKMKKEEFSPYQDEQEMMFVLINDVEAAKLKKAAAEKNKGLHISTNDALMEFLCPKRFTRWGQVCNPRFLDDSVRYGVPSNALGNTLDTVGWRPGMERLLGDGDKVLEKQSQVPGIEKGFKPDMGLLDLKMTAGALRRLIDKYKAEPFNTMSVDMDFFACFTGGPTMGITLNSWAKFSGKDWYPWEFGGKIENFIEQTHWQSLVMDMTEKNHRPFRHIVVHKSSDTKYITTMFGISMQDHEELVAKAKEILGWDDGMVKKRIVLHPWGQSQ